MMLPGAHPILSCADAVEWERQLLGGDESREWSAMTRAGRALADAVLADAQEVGGISDEARILVLCGKGHNGGDALIALHALLDARPRATTRVLVVPGFAALRLLARRALENLWRTHRPRVEFVQVSCVPDVARCGIGGTFDLCLDGLFGMQFRPPLGQPARALIDSVNANPDIRLRAAVDVPSGIGDASDAAPCVADFTYATGIAKAPVFAPANRSSVGRVRHLDLGFFDSTGPDRPSPASAILTARVLDPLRKLRPTTVDKRTYGHLFIVSGSRSMPGAVFMAVQSALLSGVGLVTAFVPESVAGQFAAQLPEAMWVPMPETPAGGLALEGRGLVVGRALRCTAVLAGPGLGHEVETLALVGELLDAVDVPAVLDADALRPELVEKRSDPARSGLVLTPHGGEFERIALPLGVMPRGDAELRQVATSLRATIALKGAPTFVCDGGPVYVSPFGGPVLARGGSGDVLAGLIAGQLAAGATPLESAARAVTWHGVAADRLARSTGQTSARVTQLLPHLAAVIQEPAE